MLRKPTARNTSFSIGGPGTVLPPHGPRPTINHVRTVQQFYGHGYAQFVGTRCIGTTRHKFVEMALSPTGCLVGGQQSSRPKRRCRSFVLFEDRPTNGNTHDRRCGHQLRARVSAFIAEEPCVVEEDDDGKHEDPEEYGGQHTILL